MKNSVLRFRLSLLISVVVSVFLASCGGGDSGGGGGDQTPTNIGGGYTLKASGGTLNDGSGVRGLVVLATLRDDQGWGPLLPWTVSISGPGISASSPLAVEYQDGQLGSFVIWEWSGFDVLSGNYRTTATNFDGSVTIYIDFSVSSTSMLARPVPSIGSAGGSTLLSWAPASNAASYAYEVVPTGGGSTVYGSTAGTSVNLGTLANGDYLVLLKSYTANLLSLNADHSASPALPSQMNIADYVFTFPVGGDQTSASYSLNAAGGILDYGLRGPNNTPIYGLSFWTSLQDITSPGNPVAPAGDWNISVTDPNGVVMNYIYPAGERHDVYWYYDIEPVSGGTYTITASYGAAVKTAAVTFADTNPALAPLLYQSISASLVSNATNTSLNDISITWPQVTGAQSYYTSLWADVWNSALKRYDYTEIWAAWVSSPAARVVNGTVQSGLLCDVYVTAYGVDMTSVAPPSPSPSRVDMSENYYGSPIPFATP